VNILRLLRFFISYFPLVVLAFSDFSLAPSARHSASERVVPCHVQPLLVFVGNRFAKLQILGQEEKDGRYTQGERRKSKTWGARVCSVAAFAIAEHIESQRPWAAKRTLM
jgi:hypothetical protein